MMLIRLFDIVRRMRQCLNVILGAALAIALITPLVLLIGVLLVLVSLRRGLLGDNLLQDDFDVGVSFVVELLLPELLLDESCLLLAVI